MGTRCGSIDPAVVLYLLNQGMTAEAISDLLYFQSGLLGLSGETDDMAALLASASAPAQQAIEQFVHHTVCTDEESVIARHCLHLLEHDNIRNMT